MKMFASIFITLGLLGITSANDDMEWKCGSKTFNASLYWSEAAVNNFCDATSKEKVNGCCSVHDDCYGRHDPRRSCDDAFCSCMIVAVDNDSHSYCKAFIPNSFCVAVEHFGQNAYDARLRKAQQLKELQNVTASVN